MKIKTRPNPPLYPEMSEEMQRLVSEGYLLFLRPLGSRLVDVCTGCCVSTENEQLLLKTPVNELSEWLIYEYLDAAYTQCQTNEIAHFLPRVLELLASHKNIRHSTEIILDKCHFEAPYWQPQQLAFMKRYSAQFVADVLKNSPYTTRLDNAMTYITMFSIAGLETLHLFSVWKEMATQYSTAIEHFELMMYYDTENYRYYTNEFSDNPKFNEEVNAWLQSPKTAKHFLPLVEKYFFENDISDEMLSFRWSCLYQYLEQQ